MTCSGIAEVSPASQRLIFLISPSKIRPFNTYPLSNESNLNCAKIDKKKKKKVNTSQYSIVRLLGLTISCEIGMNEEYLSTGRRLHNFLHCFTRDLHKRLHDLVQETMRVIR